MTTVINNVNLAKAQTFKGEEKKNNSLIPALATGAVVGTGSYFLLPSEITPKQILEKDKFELTAKDATEADKAAAKNVQELLTNISEEKKLRAKALDELFGKETEIDAEKIFKAKPEVIKTDVEAAKNETTKLAEEVTKAQAAEKTATEAVAKAAEGEAKTAALAAEEVAKRATAEALDKQNFNKRTIENCEKILSIISDKGKVTKQDSTKHLDELLKNKALEELKPLLQEIKCPLPKVKSAGKAAIWGAAAVVLSLITSKILGGKKEKAE